MDDVRFCYGLKFTSFALRTALYSEWHCAHSKSAVPPWTGSRASVPSKPQSGHASFSSVGFRSLKRKAPSDWREYSEQPHSAQAKALNELAFVRRGYAIF